MISIGAKSPVASQGSKQYMSSVAGRQQTDPQFGSQAASQVGPQVGFQAGSQVGSQAAAEFPPDTLPMVPHVGALLHISKDGATLRKVIQVPAGTQHIALDERGLRNPRLRGADGITIERTTAPYRPKDKGMVIPGMGIVPIPAQQPVAPRGGPPEGFRLCDIRGAGGKGSVTATASVEASATVLYRLFLLSADSDKATFEIKPEVTVGNGTSKDLKDVGIVFGARPRSVKPTGDANDESLRQILDALGKAPTGNGVPRQSSDRLQGVSGGYVDVPLDKTLDEVGAGLAVTVPFDSGEPEKVEFIHRLSLPVEIDISPDSGEEILLPVVYPNSEYELPHVSKAHPPAEYELVFSPESEVHIPARPYVAQSGKLVLPAGVLSTIGTRSADGSAEMGPKITYEKRGDDFYDVRTELRISNNDPYARRMELKFDTAKMDDLTGIQVKVNGEEVDFEYDARNCYITAQLELAGPDSEDPDAREPHVEVSFSGRRPPDKVPSRGLASVPHGMYV